MENPVAAIDASMDGVAVLDAEGQYTYVNQAHAEVYGYDDPAAFVGEDWRMCYADEDIAEFEAEAMPVISAEGEWRGERRGKRRDGTFFPQELSVTALDDGGMVCVVRDITERKARERELIEAKRRYQAFVEAAPDASFVADATTGELIEANSAAETLLGRPKASIVGSHLWELHPSEEQARYRELFERDGDGKDVAASQLEGVSEVAVVTPEGEHVPVEINAETVELGDRTLIQGIFRDITERKARERTLRTLHEATREMLAADTMQAVSEIASETASEGLDLPLNGVHLHEEGAGLVPVAVSPELRATIGEPPTIEPGTGIAWQAFETGDPHVHDNVHEAPAVLSPETPIRTELQLPLGGHGVFLLGSTTADDLDETDVALAKVLAANIETALDRIEYERSLAALHEGTRAMTNAETPEEVSELVVETARDALGLSLTGCWLYDPDDACLRPTAFTDEGRALFAEFPTYTAGNSLSWDVFASGEPAVYDDVGTRSGAYDPDTPIGSEIIVPLGDYGVLNSGSTEPGEFDDADVSAVRTLAANAKAALERAERETLLRDREAQLQRERNSLAALFENVSDPMYRHSRDGDAIIPEAVNPAFERVFGYEEATVVGRPITETIVPPDEIAKHEALAAASNAGESLDAEVERRTATGRRTFLLRNAPIDEPTGDQTEEYAIYTDVTERREAEEYRSRLYGITANAELPTDERVQQALALGCEYLDMEIGFLTHIEAGTQRIVEAHGPHEEIQPGNECPLSEAYCRKTIETDDPMTVRHAAEAGWEDDPAYEAFGLEAYVGTKLRIDGDLYGTVCFADRSPREADFSEFELAFIDLLNRGVAGALERHEYERNLERQNERLEEFASVISHDLRNPLNVASGFLEVARETGDESHLARIETAHRRMETLLEDVLTLARQGKAIGETSPVELAATAETAWRNVETGTAELLNGNGEGDEGGNEAELGTIEADEGRLEELFENLFRNAIEHGGEDVTVRLGRSPAVFFVEDDGPGVPEVERERVFEYGHTTTDEGTGLGLSIVEGIAEAHGWSVAVGDGTDGGARFEIHV